VSVIFNSQSKKNFSRMSQLAHICKRFGIFVRISGSCFKYLLAVGVSRNFSVCHNSAYWPLRVHFTNMDGKQF